MSDQVGTPKDDARPERLGWRVIDLGYLRHPHDWFASVVYFVGALLFFCLLYFAVVLIIRLVGGVIDARPDNINKLLLGLAGIVGAPFVVWRVLIAANANRIAEDSAAEKARIDIQNLHLNLLTKAVEQLGATREEKKSKPVEKDGETLILTKSDTVPNTEVRLGAIYALEKLARDSEELHWPIMEILCAYVRNNAGAPRFRTKEVADAYAIDASLRTDVQNQLIAKHESENLHPLDIAVQAALTVIERRPEYRRAYEITKRNELTSGQDYRLDLSFCHLAKASLRGLNFQYANFRGSNLDSSELHHTQLQAADLRSVSFVRSVSNYANFGSSNLTDAIFEKAALRRANFRNSETRYANFLSSDLLRASMEYADFRYSNFNSAALSDARLMGALLDYVNFEGSELVGVYFQAASLANANLSRANLAYARFGSAMLSSVNFDRTNLFTCDLTDALLDGAHLEHSIVDLVNLEAAWGSVFTLLPHGVSRPLNERWLSGGETNDQIQDRLRTWRFRHAQKVTEINTELRLNDEA